MSECGCRATVKHVAHAYLISFDRRSCNALVSSDVCGTRACTRVRLTLMHALHSRPTRTAALGATGVAAPLRVLNFSTFLASMGALAPSCLPK